MIFIILLNLILTIYSAFINDNFNILPQDDWNSFFNQTEEILRNNMPFSDKLRELAVNMKFISGKKEQDNIYISDDSLIKIVKNPDYAVTDANVQSIINYVSTYRVPTYAMIVPSACSIKQQEIDSLYRERLFNEKTFIENIYSDFNSYVSSVNVYPALFSNNNKSIYYKTDSNLTGLGGYYVYEQLAKRMHITVHPLDRFDIKHYNEDFYGDIYANSAYKSVSPDKISSYKFSKYSREYHITRTKNGEVNTYYELYPEEATLNSSISDIVLGGPADKIDIKIGSPNTLKLLIYGDETVMSFLTFLAVNFKEITFVNTTTATDDIYESIDIQAYDKILFSFSADNFMHNFCTKNLN